MQPTAANDFGRQSDSQRESQPTVILMRGLPSSGKSYSAKRLAGTYGLVLETDNYFHTQIGESSDVFDFDATLMPQARNWNYQRFCLALSRNVKTIVVDRGNGLNAETQRYAVGAVRHGYRVKLAEPDSPWWNEIRVLLKYREFVDESVLERWANVLAEMNKRTHRVPRSTILRRMQSWRSGLTVENILAWGANDPIDGDGSISMEDHPSQDRCPSNSPS